MSLIQKTRDVREMILEKINLERSYKAVFETPDGRRVLNHILREGFVLKSTFVAGDPHETALNEGSRRLALSILRKVRKDNNDKIQMLEENIKHE